MENKNWTVFNNTISENLNKIRGVFSNNDLVLENKKVEIERNDAKENQKEFEEWKTNLMLKVDKDKKQEFESLLKENRAILQKREDAIGRLNQTIEDLNSKYKSEKLQCENACEAIKGIFEDKDGWLNSMAETIRIQNMNVKNIPENQKRIVKKKKCQIGFQYGCKIIVSIILFSCCVAAQAFLFMIIGLKDAPYLTEGIGVNLAIVAIIVLFACEALSVRSMMRLSKKKFYIKQRFEFILSKIEIKKVSIFEIEKDLEKVLEEMK